MLVKIRDHIQLVALVSLVGISVGCSQNQGQSGSEPAPASAPGSDVPPAPPEEPPAPVMPAGYAEELQGTWESICRDASLFGLTERSVWTVNTLDLLNVTTVASRGDCKEPAVEVTQAATYEKGEEVAPSIFKIDLKPSQVRIKPLSEMGVSILRLAKFCGISDWAIGVERDVTAKTGEDSCYRDKASDVKKRRFSIEANRLFLDKVSDAPASEPRSDDLNRDFYFTKK